MSNPHYDDDLEQLDGVWDLDAILSSCTIIIVVGAGVISELLDRPMAELLRDAIDTQAVLRDGRRAIVVTDACWLREERLQEMATIAVGGAGPNAVTAEFHALSNKGLSEQCRAVLGGPMAADTAESVRDFISNGLRQFVDSAWR